MERIKVGDLVIVIGPPRCVRAKPDANVGEIFIVAGIKTSRRACGYCGWYHRPWRTKVAHAGNRKWFPFYRLKRIPPLPPERAEVERVAHERPDIALDALKTLGFERR
jgi:hypothetical protein